MINSTKLGNFDVVFDPDAPEQIFAGPDRARATTGCTSTPGPASSPNPSRKNPPPTAGDLELRDYRIDATVGADLSLQRGHARQGEAAVGRHEGRRRSISRPQMEISAVTVDGRPAEWLQRESLRLNLTRGGNDLFRRGPARTAARRARIRIRIPPFRQGDPRRGRPRLFRQRPRQLVSDATASSSPITTCSSASRATSIW